MITLTEEMFASGQPIAQGEVLIWMKKYAPKGILKALADRARGMSEMKLEHGKMILGHSETGHHHVLEPVNKAVPISQAALALIDSTNDMIVDLKIMQDCQLLHQRPNDTHGGFILPPGDYVRVIREEQTIEGWRRVAD